jgi:type IV secretory pathway protease TraF
VRSYLAGLGVPHEVHLLKRIAAVSGQRACAVPGAVRVAGRTLPVEARDRRGTPLPAWRDCRTLRAGEVFLVGDGAASFDSRYFGPVAVTQLEGVYRRVPSW